MKGLSLCQNKGTEIWLEQFSMNCFPRLKIMTVEEYKDILVVIPSFMIRRLRSLEKLNLQRCNSVKEVFQIEGLDKENQARSQLVCLNHLSLFDLPKLTHIW